jgi:hypothetical protein
MIGLPSPHALDHAHGPGILAGNRRDMRSGFDRLAERVKAVLRRDPCQQQSVPAHS